MAEEWRLCITVTISMSFYISAHVHLQYVQMMFYSHWYYPGNRPAWKYFMFGILLMSCVWLIGNLIHGNFISGTLTYFVVQSPSWEANWFAASQEIPRVLWNLKVHYRTHKLCHPSLSWASPIQSIYPHPTTWRSILILSTHLCLGLASVLLPSGFPTKNIYTPLSSPIRYHITQRNFLSLESNGLSQEVVRFKN